MGATSKPVGAHSITALLMGDGDAHLGRALPEAALVLGGVLPS